MQPSDITTPRLRVPALTRALMQADLASDRSAFSALLGAVVPADWPPEHWEPHCFAFIEAMGLQHPHPAGWNRYVVLRGSPQTLIGTVGAFPRNPTQAEIGYSILPPFRGLGYATEGSRSLIVELFREDSLQCISAQTFPHLTSSVCVMKRCGMHFAGAGDAEGPVRYLLERVPATGA